MAEERFDELKKDARHREREERRRMTALKQGVPPLVSSGIGFAAGGGAGLAVMAAGESIGFKADAHTLNAAIALAIGLGAAAWQIGAQARALSVVVGVVFALVAYVLRQPAPHQVMGYLLAFTLVPGAMVGVFAGLPKKRSSALAIGLGSGALAAVIGGIFGNIVVRIFGAEGYPLAQGFLYGAFICATCGWAVSGSMNRIPTPDRGEDASEPLEEPPQVKGF